MKEILPHIYHWTSLHPRIGIPVSSYYLADDRILIDPLTPTEGLDWFGKPPRHVLLTNRHHYRDSDVFAERFGCTVWCAEQGLHEFTDDEVVEGFRFGDRLAGGIVPVQIGAICPDETAFLIPKGDGLVAFADGVIREGDGPLGFVPDEYMGDDAASVKQGLARACRKLLERKFDHLLFAHGDPWIGGGKKALADFIGG